MRNVGKIKRLFVEDGARATIVRVLNKIAPSWLFCAHCGTVTRNDLAALPGYKGRETVVRWASAQDLREIRRFDKYCDDLPGWIARGDLFVVALRDGQIAGFENYQRGEHRFVPVPWIRVDLADDELWAVFSLVDPKYRGKGIVGHLVNFASVQLLKDGYRYVHGHSAKGDASAARAHTKRGFQSIDSWRIYRVLGTTFFGSRRLRLRGRWHEGRPLKVRIREASGGLLPGVYGKRDARVVPSARSAAPATHCGGPATIATNIRQAQA